MNLEAKSEQELSKLSRKDLVEIWETNYGSLSDLGDGYVSVTTLREAIASKREAETGVAIAESSFEFIDVEEAEAIDAEAVDVKVSNVKEFEWYTPPGSSARRKRRKK